jgi:uncharacterized membrane protein YebE (DUF533 family)
LKGKKSTRHKTRYSPIRKSNNISILALVAASKADGHVDVKERQLLDEELGKFSNDMELRRWFESEINKPLDPADVARAAKTPEMAAEMYIASVLIVDDENFMERSYLEELARQLKIDPSLKAELEAQVRQALDH